MHFNNVKTGVILAVLGAVFVVVGGVIWGTTGLVVGLLLVRGPDARVPRRGEGSDNTGRNAMPRLYVTRDAPPNAFATARNPSHAAVAVTDGILQVCNWRPADRRRRAAEPCG